MDTVVKFANPEVRAHNSLELRRACPAAASGQRRAGAGPVRGEPSSIGAVLGRGVPGSIGTVPGWGSAGEGQAQRHGDPGALERHGEGGNGLPQTPWAAATLSQPRSVSRSHATAALNCHEPRQPQAALNRGSPEPPRATAALSQASLAGARGGWDCRNPHTWKVLGVVLKGYTNLWKMFANWAPASKPHDQMVPLLIRYLVARGSSLQKKSEPYTPVCLIYGQSLKICQLPEVRLIIQCTL